MANFKWSDVELLNKESESTFKELMEEFGVKPLEMEIDYDTPVDDLFDDTDYTFVEGYCTDCGTPFQWEGMFKDMPEDFCKKCSKR